MPKNFSKADGWAAAIFGILASITVIAQILSSRSSPPPGPLVTALFNILQFILSIAFGWIVTRIVTRKEFEESRRNFAISAYRRILDIRSSFEYLKAKLAEKTQQSIANRADLELIGSMTFGIEQTIASSISDWADIIGKEIETVDAVRQLKAERDQAVTSAVIVTKTATELEQLKSVALRYEKQINELKEALPRSLRSAPMTDDADRNAISYAVDLSRCLQAGDPLYLEGFWDSDFERDIHECGEGTRVHLELALVKDRHGKVWVASDVEGRTLGQLVNASSGGYDEVFTAALLVVVGDKFTSTLTKENRTIIGRGDKDERHYFQIRVESQSDYKGWPHKNVAPSTTYPVSSSR